MSAKMASTPDHACVKGKGNNCNLKGNGQFPRRLGETNRSYNIRIMKYKIEKRRAAAMRKRTGVETIAPVCVKGTGNNCAKKAGKAKKGTKKGNK